MSFFKNILNEGVINAKIQIMTTFTVIYLINSPADFYCTHLLNF